MRKKQKKESNLKLVIIFCLLVFFLITCSLLIRFFSILSKSYFDGEHRFTISVSNNILLSDKAVLSFSPETNSISYLKVKNFNRNVGKYLKTPIDGNINFTEKNNLKGNKEDVEFILREAILKLNSIKTDLTFIDLLRLWYFTKTLPSHEIIHEQKDLLKEEINQEYAIDKLSSKLFLDYSLSQEKLSIQIINGANVTGLGNRLARFLSNSGANVISVLTSDKELQKSTIEYFGEVSYTHKRLQKILGFSLKEQKSPSISDIVIIIGKDSGNNSIF